MNLKRIVRRFLNRIGLYTAAQVEVKDKALASLRSAVEPMVQFAIESNQPDYEIAVRWDSRYFGCQSEILVRDIRNMARVACPDYEFRRLRIPETSPAYQDWLRREAEKEAA